MCPQIVLCQKIVSIPKMHLIFLKNLNFKWSKIQSFYSFIHLKIQKIMIYITFEIQLL